jgi:hypothetical protein
MTRKLSAAMAVMFISIGVAPASAQEQGFATCYMESASQSKMFYSNPVATSKSAMAGIEARYVKMLRDKRYSNVGMYDPPSAPPPTLRGACSFYVSETAATQALGATRRGAAHMGLTELTTPFDG